MIPDHPHGVEPTDPLTLESLLAPHCVSTDRDLYELSADDIDQISEALGLSASKKPGNDMKLRKATESVGWLNSVGPLTVSPTVDRPAPKEMTWYPCVCGAEHDTPTCPFAGSPTEETRTEP